MDCEKCGGQCWDESQGKFWNGGKNQQGKQKPRWKCKDKEGCGWVKYEKAAEKAAQPALGADRGTVRPTGPLAPVYTECYATAARVVAHYAKQLGQPYSMADVTAACATMFIQAAQSGRPITAPKDPPKVESKPVPVQRGDMLDEYDGPDDLPFN